MPRWAAVSAVALLAAALTACARQAPVLRGPLVSGSPNDDLAALRAVVTAFVAGEARGDQGVDTLLASGADFVASGVPITNRPRLAGMPGRGLGAVLEFRGSVAGDAAWAVVAYRWQGEDPAGAELGRASFVLVRMPAGWRIHHVHASHVERWGR